jgi:hypothetical protein
VPARVLLTIASSEDAIIAAKCAAASGGALESAKGSRKRNKSSYRINQQRAVHEVIFLLKIGNALALNSIAVPREPTGIYGPSRRLHRVVGKIFRSAHLSTRHRLEPSYLPATDRTGGKANGERAYVVITSRTWSCGTDPARAGRLEDRSPVAPRGPSRPGFCSGGTLKIFACYTLEPTAKPMDMS